MLRVLGLQGWEEVAHFPLGWAWHRATEPGYWWGWPEAITHDIFHVCVFGWLLC